MYGKKKSKGKSKNFTPCPACKNPKVCKNMGRCLKGMK